MSEKGIFNVDVERGLLILEDEDGNEEKFIIEDEIEFDGKRYLILCHEEETDLGEYIALRVEKDENGEEFMMTIEDDDELNRLQEELDKLDVDVDLEE
ncbi:MAG: DUF1292 domain-containing protein [Halanaerobiales bacterium]|nr:DUF1292 domain-containing protein [Halanaerobiales bacterium]